MTHLIAKARRLCIVARKLVTSAGGAPCVCGGGPTGLRCWAVLVPCDCPLPGESYINSAWGMYVDGEIKPVYKIGGRCYRVMGVFAYDGQPPGEPVDGSVQGWADSCTSDLCPPPPSCPCNPPNRLVQIAFPYECGRPLESFCARYAIVTFTYAATRHLTEARSDCSGALTTTAQVSKSGTVVYDLFTGQAVSGTGFSISSNATRQGRGAGCAVVTDTFEYARSFDHADTDGGLFDFPSWLVRLATLFENIGSNLVTHPDRPFMSGANLSGAELSALSDSQRRAYDAALFGGFPNHVPPSSISVCDSGTYHSDNGAGSSTDLSWTTSRTIGSASLTFNSEDVVYSEGQGSWSRNTDNRTSRLSYSWLFSDTPTPIYPMSDGCSHTLKGIHCRTLEVQPISTAGYNSQAGLPVAVVPRDGGGVDCYNVGVEEMPWPGLEAASWQSGCGGVCVEDPPPGGGPVVGPDPSEPPTARGLTGDALLESMGYDEEAAERERRSMQQGGDCGCSQYTYDA